jgi:hypothetical protein
VCCGRDGGGISSLCCSRLVNSLTVFSNSCIRLVFRTRKRDKVGVRREGLRRLLTFYPASVPRARLCSFAVEMYNVQVENVDGLLDVTDFDVGT